MKKSFKNIKTSTGGASYKINDLSSANIECPNKYLNALKNHANYLKNNDEEEYNYFLEYLDEVKFSNDYGWKTLNLQEQRYLA